MNNERRLAAAVGFDVAAVILFVAIGRRNHEEGSALTDVIETGAPFLIGLAAAWLIVRAWRRPVLVRVGIAIWPMTVLVGMITRNLVFDRGIATSFVVVATLFLGATLVGWRFAWRIIDQRSGRRQTSGGSLSLK